MKFIKKIVQSEKFISRALVTFIVRALGVTSAFVLNILVARLLGPEGAGEFYLALTLMMTVGVFVRFGLDNALIRFVSTTMANEQYKQLLGYCLVSVIIVVILGGVTGFIINMTSSLIDKYFFPQFSFSDILDIIIYGFIPISLVWLSSGILKGMKRPAQAGFIESAGIPFFTIIFLLCSSLAGYVSPEVAIICYVSAALVTSIFGISVILKRYPAKLEYSELKWRSLLATSFPMMLVALMVFIVTWSPSIFLGVYTDPVSVAYYNIAFRTAAMISFVLVVVNSIVSPRFAEHYSKGNLNEIEMLMVKSTMLMVVMIAPLVVILFVWPEWILSLFGPEFIDAQLILKIIVIGQIVNVLTGSVGHLLMMTGHEGAMKNIMIFTLCLSLILNYILVVEYGVIGVAVAVTICITVQNILMVWYVKQKLGIYTLPGWKSVKKIIARS